MFFSLILVVVVAFSVICVAFGFLASWLLPFCFLFSRFSVSLGFCVAVACCCLPFVAFGFCVAFVVCVALVFFKVQPLHHQHPSTH